MIAEDAPGLGLEIGEEDEIAGIEAGAKSAEGEGHIQDQGLPDQDPALLEIGTSKTRENVPITTTETEGTTTETGGTVAMTGAAEAETGIAGTADATIAGVEEVAHPARRAKSRGVRVAKAQRATKDLRVEKRAQRGLLLKQPMSPCSIK